MHQANYFVESTHPLRPPRDVRKGTLVEHVHQPDTNIRARYDRLMDRLRRIATDPVRRIPDNDYLPALHRGALTLAKRVYHGIRQSSADGSDNPASQYSPAALLAAGETLLNRHDRQQRILVELKELALELCGLIAEMPRERPPKYTKLVELAERIRGNAGLQTTIEHVLPEPGMPLVEIFADVLPTLHARVYVEAVTAAQLIAQATAAHPIINSREQLQQLIVAALLRDVGCLAIDPRVVDDQEQLDATQLSLYRRHPRLSAAMIGRMHLPPISVARLVARHHERLDGSGFPASISDLQFNEPLRLLTVATQYVALYRPPVAVHRFVSHPDHRRRELASELAARAARGHLDTVWVERIVGDMQRPDEFRAATNIDVSTASQRHLHADHVQPPGPHRQTRLKNDSAMRHESAVPQPH